MAEAERWRLVAAAAVAVVAGQPAAGPKQCVGQSQASGGRLGSIEFWTYLQEDLPVLPIAQNIPKESVSRHQR